MGKNRKEQAAYDYLHDNNKEKIPNKLLHSIKNKWNRHNFDWDLYRKERIEKKDSDFLKDREENDN